MFVENRLDRHRQQREHKPVLETSMKRTYRGANRKEASPRQQVPKLLPSKLQRLQPLNIFALIRYDLRLPDQADAHHRHHQQADDENDILLRLGSRTSQLLHV
jgi:hypothetical protein